MKLCVVGGGWAGLAAAVAATQAGHQVTVLEASHHLGGRARAVPLTLADGSPYLADNGQHILIGAYTETLRLLRTVGVNPDEALLRRALCLQFPDGRGLQLPDAPSPLDALAGLLGVRGWTAADKAAMLWQAARWQLGGFRCAAHTSVAQLCAGLPATVMRTLIEPLCISALNTPTAQASGQVFLRVLRDALLGGRGSSNLLIPRVDLSSLFPDAAWRWLQQQGCAVRLGCRVSALTPQPEAGPAAWQLQTTHGPAAQGPNPGSAARENYDAVILATSSSVAAALVGAVPRLQPWARTAAALQFEAIATVYLQVRTAPGQALPPANPLPLLPEPMLALPSDAEHPAQFVFDKAQLGGPAGLLACVVSASTAERDMLTRQVTQQVRSQLAAFLHGADVVPVQTIVEKRATFACTPGLQRPANLIAPGLGACGDYVEGPYPATLEGAVRSALMAVDQLSR